MLGQNCQICGNRGKTLKFKEEAQICEFCESRNARKKFTAVIIANGHMLKSFIITRTVTSELNHMEASQWF